MTECERFVNEGLFTPDFFKEEVRCDFLVTTERKKIWAVLIDLLWQLDAICKRHGLKYWTMYGSLLGAVRHQGFVPWYDDLDVVMMRDDYEKLMRLANEFSEPYFLQTPETDCNSYFSYAKLRNSRTSCIHKNFMHRDINMGILLDIFPLDNFVDDGRAGERFDRIKWLIMENSTYMRIGNPNLSEVDRMRVAAWSGRDPLLVYKEIQSLARQFEDWKDAQLVCPSTLTVYPLKKSVFRKEWFSGTERLRFEGFYIQAPLRYEELLRAVYGDYMQFPPVEKRGMWHSGVIWDPDVSYITYLKDGV